MTPTGFNQNKKIHLIIPSQSEELTNVPVLVNLMDNKRPASVNDDFTGTDGDAPNELLWETGFDVGGAYTGSVGTKEILNNRYNNSLVASTDPVRMVTSSLFVLSGDFDVQVDFDTNGLAGDDQACGLAVNDIPLNVSTSNYAFIGRYTINNIREYRAYDSTGGHIDYISEDITGKLRLVRSGSSLEYFRWDGSSWVSVRTYSYVTHDIYVTLYANIYGTNDDLNVDFDNFTVNSGTIVWPDEINKGSGVLGTDVSAVFDELAEPISVDDDFTGTDGDAPNEVLWTKVVRSSDTMAINNNKLKVTGDGSLGFGSASVISSKYDVSGDFDVQFLYDLISVPNVQWITQLQLVFDANNSGYIRIQNDGSVKEYAGRCTIGGVNQTFYTTTTSDISGYLRIRRVGSALESMYSVNGTSWTTLWTYSPAPTGNLTSIKCQVYSAASNPTEIDIDNFTVNSGTIIWPENPLRKKIAVVDTQTGEQCFVEIENWNQTNKSAQLHIKVPTITTEYGANLALYYDSAADDNTDYVGDTGDAVAQQVWTDSFVFLSHQAQDPTDSVLDSTSYAKNGTSHGSMTSDDLIDGTTGKMIEYDGTDDYTRHGYDAAHDITDVLTIRTVIKPSITLDSGLGGNRSICGRQNDPSAGANTYLLFINTDGKLQFDSYGGNIQSTTASWAAGETFVVTATYNSTGLVGDLFVNGVKEVLTSNDFDPMSGSTNNLVIGRGHSDGNDFFPGAIDEVAIIHEVKSDTWITLDSLAIRDNLITFSLEEILPGWDVEKRIGLTIPSQNHLLTDVPVLINLGNTSGVNDFDTSAVLEEFVLDSYTKLLISSDTIDGDTSFTDSSNNHTISAFGAAHHETDQSKFGDSAIHIDGNGDYLYLDDSDDWHLGDQDFTVDGWFRRVTIGSQQTLFSQNDNIGTQATRGFIMVMFDTDNTLMIRFGDGTEAGPSMFSTFAFSSTSSWYHIAIVKSSNTLYLYVNGIQDATVLDLTGKTGYNSPYKLAIGRLGEYSSRYFNGYIDEFRFSKGIARWTGNFTPPIAPYTSNKRIAICTPDLRQLPVEIENWESDNAQLWTKIPEVKGALDSYTKLLISSDTIDGSTDFIDSSASGHIVTGNGNAHHEIDQAKFGDTSIYFDGTGDYLTISHHGDFNIERTDSFTIDGWIRYTGVISVLYMIYAKYSSGGVGINVMINSTGLVGFLLRNTTDTNQLYVLTTNSIPTNEWTHIAVCYTGTSTSEGVHLFINGVLEINTVDTDNLSASILNTDDVEIGIRNGLYEYNGYIDELRISKGIARWTSNFTPPTYPYVEEPTEDTVLYLYYDSTHEDNTDYVGDTGDAAAQQVWDSNFVAVYHMAQDPSGGTDCILDSTSNVNHGTPYGGMTNADLTSGLYGKGIRFDGIDDYILSDVITPTGGFTIETSFNKITLESVCGIVSVNNSNPLDATPFYILQDDNGTLRSYGVLNEYSNVGTIVADTWYSTTVTRNSSELETTYFEGEQVTTIQRNTNGNNSHFAIGVGYNAYSNVIIDEVRISNISRSDDWLLATNLSNSDDLISYGNLDYLQVTFLNPYPSGGIKKYGLTQTLYINPIVSDPSICDYSLNFYLTNNSLIDTISGTACSGIQSTALSTTSGINYNWYVEAVFPNEASFTSDTYSFYVRYLCSGICNNKVSQPASGINVMAHRRTTGELMGQTTTAGDGRFAIDTLFNEQHYVVALHPDETFNALVYDHVAP